MHIKFKKLADNARLPSRNHETDTGYDIYAVESKVIWAGDSDIVDVGLQVAYIEPGFWFRIEPRSGLGFKHGIQPHLGVIDQAYRGYLSVKLYNFSKLAHNVKAGDRIAQIVIYPVVNADMEFTDTIEETKRSDAGLGSSGR